MVVSGYCEAQLKWTVLGERARASPVRTGSARHGADEVSRACVLLSRSRLHVISSVAFHCGMGHGCTCP